MAPHTRGPASPHRGRYNFPVLPGTYVIPAAMVFIAGGTLACFAGYRMFRYVLGIYGFILGALVATSILPPNDTPSLLVTALVGGVVGAGVLVVAYFAGIALAGAALAAVLVHVGFSQFGREPHALVVIAACVVGALVALGAQRLVIIVATAFGGAWTLLVGVVELVGGVSKRPSAKAEDWLVYPFNPAPDQRWMVLVWVIVGAVGLAAQLGWTVRSGKKKRAKAAEQ